MSAPLEARRALLLAALALGGSCADRDIDDSSAPYEPAEEERTREDILEDFCRLFFDCDPAGTSYPTFWSCIEQLDALVTAIDAMAPKGCGPLVLNAHACISAADSCADYFARSDRDTDLQCEALRVQSDDLDCLPPG